MNHNFEDWLEASVVGTVMDLRPSVRGPVWASVRDYVWDSVMTSMGASVRDSVRVSVGDSL